MLVINKVTGKTEVGRREKEEEYGKNGATKGEWVRISRLEEKRKEWAEKVAWSEMK